MAKICMVTIQHAPDDDRIFQKEAKSLRKAGHEVVVLCVADESGRVWSMGGREQLNPDHEQEFWLEGIRIKAVLAPQNGFERLLKKGFKGGYIRRFVNAGRAIKADVYHAHEPVSYHLANQMAANSSAKVIFDSHESWIDGTFREKWVKHFHLHKLQYLITANSITRGHLLGLNPQLTSCEIYNYPQQAVFNKPFNAEKSQQLILAHDGILPFNRGLREMLEVLKLVTRQHPQVKLRIVGSLKGEEQAYTQAKAREYQIEEHLEVTGWVPYHKVPDHLQDCSIGLIMKTYRPLNNLLGGPAIKLFNYFASGMAVVDAGLHESTRFLDSTRSGISIKERSVEAIAEAIVYLIENPDLLKQYCQRSHEVFQTFNWENGSEQKLLDFYEKQVLSDAPYLIR